MTPLRRRARTFVQTALGRFGYELVRTNHDEFPPDYDERLVDLFREVRPYTLTSHERVAALVKAVSYLSGASIPGAIVECGVWRGGSMLAAARTLVDLGDVERDLYLFDTFETMPYPGDEDVDVWGNRAADFYDAAIAEPGFAYLPQGRVEALLRSTGYPPDRLHFVKGMVEDTIPMEAPTQIALCRLDTDWYVSTAHEMKHLFPRISPGGVLIVDDYGHFMGAKQAVDEYFQQLGLPALLHRIDFTGRELVVTEALHQASVARSR